MCSCVSGTYHGTEEPIMFHSLLLRLCVEADNLGDTPCMAWFWKRASGGERIKKGQKDRHVQKSWHQVRYCLRRMSYCCEETLLPWELL